MGDMHGEGIVAFLLGPVRKERTGKDGGTGTGGWGEGGWSYRNFGRANPIEAMKKTLEARKEAQKGRQT